MDLPYPQADGWDLTLDFSPPDKPIENAFIEAFNNKLRSECMVTHRFLSIAQARARFEERHRYHDDDRPYGGISNKPPIIRENLGDAARPSP